MKKQVLFLCTGNSLPQPDGEGLVNHYLGDEWQAFSAGTEPAGYVHPLAVQAMAELGIDISHQQTQVASMSFEMLTLMLVVTVCDDAAEDCPFWLGKRPQGHIGFADPAKATGSSVERLAVFRRVRDEIRREILYLLVNRIRDSGFILLLFCPKPFPSHSLWGRGRARRETVSPCIDEASYHGWTDS